MYRFSPYRAWKVARFVVGTRFAARPTARITAVQCCFATIGICLAVTSAASHALRNHQPAVGSLDRPPQEPTRREPQELTTLNIQGKGKYMKRRSLLKFGSMSGALAIAGQVPISNAQAADTGPIKVGILHSLSGTMAISETSLKDIALMTIDEINANGGVLGRKLEPVVVDPASNWPLFAEKARQLITQDKVAVTFGCWTSVSRKSVLPVFEELNGLLFYPVQYEGEEMSKNVFYTGAAPNQQAIPAVEYLMSKEGGGAKRFFLLGTDYVYPRTTNKILRAFLHSKGVKDDDIQEVYTPFGHSDYQTIVANIKTFSQGGKTAVISTINGDSNVPFYKELGNQGIKATDVPVVAFSVGEEELRGIDTKPLVGHLAAWNYFMSLKNPDNTKFIGDVRRLCEGEQPAGRRQARDERSDGSDVRRHPHVEAGGREGQEHRRRQGARGDDRPEVRGAVGLHARNGRQPPSAQAGDDRRDARRRPIQRGVEDEEPDPRAAVEPVYRRQRQGSRTVVSRFGVPAALARRAKSSVSDDLARSRAPRRGLSSRPPTRAVFHSKAIMGHRFDRAALRAAIFARRSWQCAFIACRSRRVRADAADVAPLAGDDFDAKSAAIDKLIADADAPSLAVLKALADETLRRDRRRRRTDRRRDDGDKPTMRNRQDRRSRRRATGHAQQPAARESRGRVVGPATRRRRISRNAARRHRRVARRIPDPSMKPLIDAARCERNRPDAKTPADALWAMTALHDPTRRSGSKPRNWSPRGTIST